MSRMVEPLTSGRSEPPGEPSRRSEPPDSDFRRDQNRLPQHLGSDGTVKGRRQALRKALKANEATEESSASRPIFSVGGGRKWVQSQFSRTKGWTDEISCCTEIKDIAAHLVLRSQDTRHGSKVSSPMMERIPCITLEGISIALPLIVLGMTGSITGSSKKSAGPSKRCTSRRGQFVM